ncbi:hypothetical protein ACA910_002470 [Epithemia clementina (nom. ined.)]
MTYVSKLSVHIIFIILASSPFWTSAFYSNHAYRNSKTSVGPLFMETPKPAVQTTDGNSVTVFGPPPSSQQQSTSPAPTKKVDRLTSLEAFCDYIDNAPKDSLVAVKFFGKSCPLCKRVALKYKRMAQFYAMAPIQFAEIEKTVNPQLFDSLEITTFPYLQLYRNGQCIASHGTQSESMFERIVHDTIQHFLLMQGDHWESFLTSFAEPIGKATRNYQTMRQVQNNINISEATEAAR